MAAHPDTLAFHCSDGRFTHAVEWLMQQHRIQRYDVVAMPGGPALLDMAGATILEAEASRAGVSFLVQGHGIRQAFLIAHTGCGFYRKRLAGQTPEKIVQRQVRDLQIAGAWFRRVHPPIVVRAFLAIVEPSTVDERRRVRFDRIEIDETMSSLLL